MRDLFTRSSRLVAALVLSLSVSGRCDVLVPKIVSFSPASGRVGDLIKISGANFSGTPANNTVYFGSEKGNVTAATDGELTVAVPNGAICAPLSVTANGLLAYSTLPFDYTFPSAGVFDSSSLSAMEPLSSGGGPGPAGVAIADIDGDGKPDLVAANWNEGTVSVYRNISSPGTLAQNSFAPRVVLNCGNHPYFVSVGDVDGDGKLDIAVANSGSTFVSVFRNISTPGSITAASFAARVDLATTGNPVQVAFCDLNGDGKPDLVAANTSGSTVSVFRNLGGSGAFDSSRFAPVVDFAVEGQPWRLAVGDIDGDGMPDLVVPCEGSSSIEVLRNTTVAGSDVISFAPKVGFGVGSRPLNAAVGDLDGDGKLDVAVSTYGDGVAYVFRNTSQPGVIDQTSFAAKIALQGFGSMHSVQIGDVNGDGKLDLITTSESTGSMSVFINQSKTGVLVESSFAPRLDFNTHSDPITAAVGDLDGDGRSDIVTGNYGGNDLSLFHNQSASPNPVISIQPMDQAVAVGSTATFSVVAQGPSLAYQWYSNSTNLLANETNSSLVLSNVHVADCAAFLVVVTNDFGSVTSRTAVLKVMVAPTISVQPQSQDVSEGTNVVFGVQAAGEGLGYQWFFSGSPIIDQTNASLVISNVHVLNAGDYYVMVTNEVASVQSSNATLTVERVPVLPVISTQPLDQTLAIGSDVRITVGISGRLPDVTSGTLRLWLKADNGVIVDSQGRVSKWRDLSGNTNDAFQADLALQPTLVNPSAIFGRYAVRFDGIQTPSDGDFMNGVGDVGIPDAYTSFLVYSKADRIVTERIPVLIGVPGSYSSVRDNFFFSDGRMMIGAWANDYDTGLVPAINTYRIWTDRINATLSHADVYDTTVSNKSHFDLSISGWNAPSAGYYIGGVGPEGRNFGGDIAEVIYYRGALSEPDRLAVEDYLAGRYLNGTAEATASFQWIFNGTIIADATNAVLTLTNAQTDRTGGYSVIVSNSVGAVTSAVAKITIVPPPQITSQPVDASAAVGGNATFTVAASGDGLLYQWQFNKSDIVGATNATLSITNCQYVNQGSYSVKITNLVGSIVSSNANLTVVALPMISQQPSNLSLIVGSTAQFSLVSEPVLPQITSGDMRLWLKADAGVVADSLGRVSQWKDQSGQTNDAFQINTNQQPVLVRSDKFLGRPALRFDGIQSSTTGDFLHGTGDVGIPSDFTSFAVYRFNGGNNVEHEIAFVGTPWDYNNVRSYYIRGLELAFSAWANDYGSGFSIPTNTARIWTYRMRANKSYLDSFDTSSTATNKFTFSLQSIGTPSAGYYVGGLGSAVRNFGGDVAELVFFRGALSDVDRTAIEKYLKDKYFNFAGSDDVTYQWQLNGTNIVGATNSSLTISNVQPADAGCYTVVLSNPAGSVTSSNAVLTVNVPPSITGQPQSQAVIGGGSVTLTATVAGTAPISCQWLFNGATITGQTNLSLTLANVQPASAGAYQLSITSPYGSALSSNAVITVAAAKLVVVNTSGVGASTVTVPIKMVALGNENAVGFSLNFDPSVLTLVDVAQGSGASSDAMLLTNTFQLASGKLGFSIALQPDASFAAGTQEIALVTFAIAPLTLSQVTPISITSDPIPVAVVSPDAHRLSFTTVNGTISITQADYEADVTPKADGIHEVTAQDWVKVGRFVAGLDVPSSPAEFQRADCAPRDTLGNGKLTVTDWVQAGRYAMHLDPFTPAGGPTAAKQSIRTGNAAGGNGPVARSLTIRALPVNGATNSFYIELSALGLENAVGFSLQFDPTVLKFVGTGAGSIPSVAANVNQNLAASGQIGFTIGVKPGASFPSGTQQLIRVDFVALSYVPKSVNLAFINTPVAIELSDPTAQTLGMTPVDSTFFSIGLPLPSLTVTAGNPNILLSWPSSASAFTLESSTNFSKGWTSVPQSPVIDGDKATTAVPAPTNAMFFRLKL